MISTIQGLALLALLSTAVIGGVFFAFSSFILRALHRLPAAQGLAAMQSINVTVLNRSFLGTFFAAAVLSLAATALGVARWGEPGAAAFLAAGALYLVGTFLVTGLGNVPLNEAIANLDPEAKDSADAWADYLQRWTRWNHVRTLAALLAAAAFGVGMVQVG